MKNKLHFIATKIKRYGILGCIRVILTRILVKFLFKYKVNHLYIIKHRGVKYRLFDSNVSRVLLDVPNIHDGDVAEILSLVNPGSVYIDIGANIGTTTLPISKCVKKMLSIEAHPDTVYYLRENIKLNGYTNIDVLQVAVGEACGTVNFSDSKTDDINKVSYSGGLVVPMLTLDDIARDIPFIDLIKIDVEGYEKFVLMGAKNTLAKTRALYIEYYEPNTLDFGYTREEIWLYLEQAGFSCHFSDMSKHLIKVDNIVAIKNNISLKS